VQYQYTRVCSRTSRLQQMQISSIRTFWPLQRVTWFARFPVYSYSHRSRRWTRHSRAWIWLHRSLVDSRDYIGNSPRISQRDYYHSIVRVPRWSLPGGWWRWWWFLPLLGFIFCWHGDSQTLSPDRWVPLIWCSCRGRVEWIVWYHMAWWWVWV
jgi:hypothetical protein